MKRIWFVIAFLSLGAGWAQADVPGATLQLAQSPTGNSNNPYNSPIRRANPNSMQGTQPSTPPIRGPNTVPMPRQPTVENRGIGNGQPIRSVPSASPVFIPNPPSRSTGTTR